MIYALSEIGDRLRAERERRGLSQRAIADQAGTSQARVSHLESGEKDVRASFLIEYARLLDLELVLVPRENITAVKSIITRAPPTAQEKSLRTALQRLNDTAVRLNAREPGVDAIAEIIRLSGELFHLRLQPSDIAVIKGISDTLKRIEETPARINTAKAAATEFRALRNTRIHALSEAADTPKPAYSLDDDDDE